MTEQVFMVIFYRLHVAKSVLFQYVGWGMLERTVRSDVCLNALLDFAKQKRGSDV